MTNSKFERRPSRQRFVAPAAAVFVAVVSLLVLSGWVFDVSWMRALIPGQVTMKANTAVALLAASIALLLAEGRPGSLRTVVRMSLEILIVFVGTATLAQYALGIEIPLDEIFSAAPSEAYLTSAPGRMAPTTALSLVLIASGMLIDYRQAPRARVVSRALYTLALLVGLTTVLGYAYGAPALYLITENVTAMSMTSAVLLMVLAMGCIWLRYDRGFPAMLTEQTVVGTHIRSLIPMVVGAPLLAGFTVVLGYGSLYEGRFAIALTSLASVVAAALVAIVSVAVLKRADEALYIRDRALNSSTSGVLITDHRDAEEPIIYLNDAFEALTGYTREEVTGQNCRFLNVGVDNDAETMAALRQCVRDGGSEIFELKNRHKDGSIFWNRLSIAPVETHDGEITHLVGVIDDITEKREQEVRLQVALEDAHEASAMRDTFVRLVSHELRTPLNAALTWIRLMEVDDSDATRDKGLGIVAQSIESQSRLIDDLVDVSRFASAGVQLEFESVDLREIVQATVDELRPTLEPALQLSINIEDGDYVAECDPLRVQQIVRNLLSNAAKYTPGGGSVEVRVARDGETIELAVSDTGIGLGQDELEQVFEPFWRADSNQPGLGVGLAIVAALVGAHGGDISVDSAGKNHGSTFTVRLPV